MITLSAKDKARLRGVHQDLQKVVLRAAVICPADLPFTVTEGLRSIEQQKLNVAKGVSKTMRSRHLTGHAVDVAPTIGGKASYAWPLYYRLEKVIKQAARDVGVTVEWGGDWKKFKDGPHWQLPWAKYPLAARGFLGTGYAPNEEDDYETHPEYTGETEDGAAVKSAAYAAMGASTGGGIAADPLMAVADGLSTQQYEITSGDILRIVIGLVIIGIGVWAAYKTAKG